MHECVSVDVGDPVLKLQVLRHVIVSAIVQMDPALHKPVVRQTNLSGLIQICINFVSRLLDLYLTTHAVLPRLSVHPGRSSFVAICPRHGPEGHQEHKGIGKKASVMLGTVKQEEFPDQSR